MSKRAKEGTPLAELVRLGIGTCQQAERENPRQGPGRRPTFPDWALAALIMITTLKQRQSKSAQYRFLTESWEQLKIHFPDLSLPARSSYFDRYRRAYKLYQVAIVLQGRRIIEDGIADASCVAVDKTLIASQGRPWHRKDRKQNKVPRGVDRDSQWGYSEHNGWVQGYSAEVAVSSGENGVVVPLIASVGTANIKEQTSVKSKIDDLPSETKAVLVDTGYDSNELAERVEWTPQGKRTGRRYLCRHPSRKRHAKKKWRETEKRRQHRERREERAGYLKTATGKRLYARRGKTVEPFFSWFKNCFNLQHRVHHWGLDNNQTQIAAAIFCYQLLLRYNYNHGNANGVIQWILDSL